MLLSSFVSCKRVLSLKTPPARFLTSASASSKLRRKADFKRKQGGDSYTDYLRVRVLSGKGGNGAVAFYRAPGEEKGPPSGGEGGDGGSVYIAATRKVSSLAHIPTVVKAPNGLPGKGDWERGTNGLDIVLQVPPGTLVYERVVPPKRVTLESGDKKFVWENSANTDSAGSTTEAESSGSSTPGSEEPVFESLAQITHAILGNKLQLKYSKTRDRLWEEYIALRKQDSSFKGRFEEPTAPQLDSHVEDALSNVRQSTFALFPGENTDNMTTHTHFLELEKKILQALRRKYLSKDLESLHKIDLAEAEFKANKERAAKEWPDLEDQPVSQFDPSKPVKYLLYDFDAPTFPGEEILLAPGGPGGQGNSSFASVHQRSPKYALRGESGNSVELLLELKSISDVGFVGLPNAGKSTLLQCLTHSRPRIASYAFTTLNPHHGICTIMSDGTFKDNHLDDDLITDTYRSPDDKFFSADSDTESLQAQKSRRRRSKQDPSLTEVMRFTLTDNPGLIENASQDVGLGHDFLRHIERCKVIVFVVDISQKPEHALDILRKELDVYAQSRYLGRELRRRIGGLILTKADKLTASEGPQRLHDMKSYVEKWNEELAADGSRQAGQPRIWVKPVSGMHRQNLRPLALQLAETVSQEKAN